MKTIIFLLISTLFVACQRKDANNDHYLQVHDALTKNSTFKEFVGYEIIPREENYYVVILSKPEVTLYVLYSENEKIKVNIEGINALRDSLSKYNPGRVDEEKEKILKNIGKLIFFMKKELIHSVGYSLNVGNNLVFMDTANYCIDFTLSSYEHLIYFNKLRKPKEVHIDSINIRIWIDSSWVYLKNKPPEGTK